MPGYRAIRPGDLIAVRTTDPRYDETHVVLDTVADCGDYIILAGAWKNTTLEVIVRRVGNPTLTPMEK